MSNEVSRGAHDHSVTQPLVSVCMPCYNAERYVAAAIESVLAQTYPAIELIVVNDGSTDGSAGVLQTFKDRGVKVIEQSNAGQCVAANRALAQASGSFIKFFDADDLLAPEMIERQVRTAIAWPGVIPFGEWARFHAEPSEAEFQPLPMYRDASAIDWLTSEWATGSPMMQCGMFLIPRQVLEKTGGWDKRLSLINDFEFFARVLLAAGELKFTPSARLYYRSGITGSLSGTVSRKAAESAALSLRLGSDYLLAAEDSPRTRRAAANILMTFEYTFYPLHPDLRATLATRIAELGGSDLSPVGPPGFHKLRRFVGWRTARRIQRIAERHGLNGAGRRQMAAR